MNWQSIRFDWNQVRAFLVTAEEGSLSAAARELRLTQPTLSRQVAALEQELGVTLFERAGRALILTETGLALLEHVRAMGEAANRVSLAASGQSEAVEGKVTITATDMASTYILPDILLKLAERAPGISIDIVASNDVRDLQRREADIALRNAPPTEPDLIARRLRPSVGCFATARSYLDRHGPIETVEELQQADWIAYSDPVNMAKTMQENLGIDIAPDRFRYSCDLGVAVWELVRTGLGVTVMTDEMILDQFGLVRLLPDFPDIPIPLFLITHSELRTSRRIRVVFDLLAEELSRPQVFKAHGFRPE